MVQARKTAPKTVLRQKSTPDDQNDADDGGADIERALIGNGFESGGEPVHALDERARKIIGEKTMRVTLQIGEAEVGEILHRAAFESNHRQHAAAPPDPGGC